MRHIKCSSPGFVHPWVNDIYTLLTYAFVLNTLHEITTRIFSRSLLQSRTLKADSHIPCSAMLLQT